MLVGCGSPRNPNYSKPTVSPTSIPEEGGLEGTICFFVLGLAWNTSNLLSLKLESGRVGEKMLLVPKTLTVSNTSQIFQGRGPVQEDPFHANLNP